MTDSNQHSIRREGTDYESDQPITYEVECSCGEVFDHIVPRNAQDQWHNHVVESLEEQLETYRSALQYVDDLAPPNAGYAHIVRAALNPAKRLDDIMRDVPSGEFPDENSVFFPKEEA